MRHRRAEQDLRAAGRRGAVGASLSGGQGGGVGCAEHSREIRETAGGAETTERELRGETEEGAGGARYLIPFVHILNFWVLLYIFFFFFTRCQSIGVLPLNGVTLAGCGSLKFHFQSDDLANGV